MGFTFEKNTYKVKIYKEEGSLLKSIEASEIIHYGTHNKFAFQTKEGTYSITNTLFLAEKFDNRDDRLAYDPDDVISVLFCAGPPPKRGRIVSFLLKEMNFTEIVFLESFSPLSTTFITCDKRVFITNIPLIIEPINEENKDRADLYRLVEWRNMLAIDSYGEGLSDEIKYKLNKEDGSRIPKDLKKAFKRFKNMSDEEQYNLVYEVLRE